MTKDKRPTNDEAAASPSGRLSIEDTCVALARLGRPNKMASGFDPYAGALAPKPPARKKDLRKLGEWIEAKQKAEELKRQEAALSDSVADSTKSCRTGVSKKTAGGVITPTGDTVLIQRKGGFSGLDSTNLKNNNVPITTSDCAVTVGPCRSAWIV